MVSLLNYSLQKNAGSHRSFPQTPGVNNKWQAMDLYLLGKDTAWLPVLKWLEEVLWFLGKLKHLEDQENHLQSLISLGGCKEIAVRHHKARGPLF
jgi:hypothetical protein